MLRKTLIVAAAVIVTALAVSPKAQAWGGYRHVGYTHYSPYTGLHHYGYTEAYRGGYGDRYGGDRYGGYHYGYGGYSRYYGGYHYGYGGDAYGGARYGYYRRW
jgi:hypothetical protein